jgi:hypothetical protein
MSQPPHGRNNPAEAGSHVAQHESSNEEMKDEKCDAALWRACPRFILHFASFIALLKPDATDSYKPSSC